jgi:YVTN family beta-propeller protein
VAKTTNSFFDLYKGIYMNRISQKTYVGVFLCLLFSAPTHAQRNTVVATINTGVTPDGLAITSDNHYAYVVNNNNYDIPNQDSVTVLNLKNNSIQQTIYDSSFNEPFRVALSPDNKKAYVANSNGTTLSIIDTKSNTVTGTIGGFDGPSGIAITPNGAFAYVNNYGGPDGVGSGNGTTVSVVDLKANDIIDTITVGQAPAALAMSPDGKFVYVINYVDGNPGTGTMSILSTKNNMVIGTISGFSGPFGIAITPNGKYAYVTNFGSNNFAPIGTTVSIVNLFDRKIVTSVDTSGIQPSGIAITPDGRFAYVTNYNTLYAGANFSNLTAGQGTVNIIDTKTKKIIPPTIAVGQSPNAIAISPNGKFAYVTDFTSNTVDVIRLKD